MFILLVLPVVVDVIVVDEMERSKVDCWCEEVKYDNENG